MSDEFRIDLDRVPAFLREKDARRSARLDARFAQARRDAPAIVPQIASQVNPRRVYQ